LTAILFDPIGQGERRQFCDAHGKSTCGGCLGEHNAVGAACIPLGHNLASWMIWDGIRGLDYLGSRPDIRGDRLGCMGNSGGGTQTSSIAVLDDRVVAAAISCYVTSLHGKLPRTLGAQDAEQNIFGQLAVGMDHADYLLMRAPRPTLVCAATRDFFDIGDTRQAVADATRIYGIVGSADGLALAEADAEHGFSQPLREATWRFMLRWLADRSEQVTEPAKLPVLTPEEIACTPTGSVLALPGARTFADLAADGSRRLADARKARGPLDAAALRDRARSRSGMRSTDASTACGTIHDVRSEAGVRIERLSLETEKGNGHAARGCAAVMVVIRGGGPAGSEAAATGKPHSRRARRLRPA
jgi:dienelactone hydrolase